MKNMILGMIFLLLSNIVYSQSWTIQGGPSNDTEFTVITVEQFDRVRQANEFVARAVMVEFLDYTIFMNAIRNAGTIRGSIPTFNGYFFLTTRLIPKNDAGRLLAGSTSANLIFGNTRTNSIMSIRFLNTDNVNNSLSLRYEWNEYVRQYNQLLRLVTGE